MLKFYLKGSSNSTPVVLDTISDMTWLLKDYQIATLNEFFIMEQLQFSRRLQKLVAKTLNISLELLQTWCRHNQKSVKFKISLKRISSGD